MNHRRIYLKAAAVVGMALFMGFCLTGRAAASPMIYRGMHLQAVSPDPGETFDVDLMNPDTALAKIRDAVDLIYEQSRENGDAIDAILGKGTVYLVYNPNYPNRRNDLSGIRVALFLPHYFETPLDGAKPPVPVIISRHGIKWPLARLASVIVHELVGHGNQYLSGLMETARPRELECQAWLYEELAHQHFGLDKFSPEMIKFRKELGGSAAGDGQCSDFFRFIQDRYPEKLGLWERLDPDVPALLDLLDIYIAHLERSGEAGKSLKARDAWVREELNRLARFGSPGELFGTGIFLLEGAGYRQDPERALAFLTKSAEAGYTPALKVLASLYKEGRGVKQDFTRAAVYFRRAAERNDATSQYQLSLLYTDGKGVARDRERAYFWLCVADRGAGADLKASIRENKARVGRSLSREIRSRIRQRAEDWHPAETDVQG